MSQTCHSYIQSVRKHNDLLDAWLRPRGPWSDSWSQRYFFFISRHLIKEHAYRITFFMGHMGTRRHHLWKGIVKNSVSQFLHTLTLHTP